MVNIIPLPLKSSISNGNFSMKDLRVKSDFELELLDVERTENANLIIKKNPALDKEEYTLDIGENEITITASSEIGAYYALQSLRQLSKNELGRDTVKCCKIEDKPRFSWRGLQLDESRHFFGKEEIKKLLDMMFMMKLNVFHWHLTDDQGWRVEIKKYPLLTEIGSVRHYTQINGWRSTEIINEEYGGYYTQQDIKEIVEYADKRGIMIVPEIDFPAHCASAIAAYPWLACRELDREVPGYFGGIIPELKLKMGDWNRTICVGKDKTLEMVFDIIDEICELFPAPYFHIGGDEAPKNEWKKCPECQKRIKENNLKDEEALQGWFNNLILEHLKKKGKRLIGWNEIFKAVNLDKSVIGQYWTPQRDKRAEAFVNNGGQMIMSNHQSFYFDMTYGQYSLRNTYDFTPAKFNVTDKGVENVLGVEGENWTEWIDTPKKLQLQMYPRVQALAEVAWTDESLKSWNGFKKRLDDFKPYFEYLDINYAVDKISLPKNIFTKLKIQKKFFRGDTHLELKLNEKYKAQGEK